MRKNHATVDPGFPLFPPLLFVRFSSVRSLTIVNLISARINNQGEGIKGGAFARGEGAPTASNSIRRCARTSDQPSGNRGERAASSLLFSVSRCSMRDDTEEKLEQPVETKKRRNKEERRRNRVFGGNFGECRR